MGIMDQWEREAQERVLRQHKQERAEKKIGITIAVVLAVAIVVVGIWVYTNIKRELAKPFVAHTYQLSEGIYRVGSEALPDGKYRLSTLEKNSCANVFVEGKKSGKNYFVTYEPPTYKENQDTVIVGLDIGNYVTVSDNAVGFTTLDPVAIFR